MRKFVSVIMSVAVMVSCLVMVSASSQSSNDDLKIVSNSVYGYSYTEYSDENNQIIRDFKKDVTTRSALKPSAEEPVMSLDCTKALLSDLGMGDYFIEKLSEEELQAYADSEHIYSVSSYTKTDSQGKVVNVTEEEAMSAAAGSRSAVPRPELGGDSEHYDTAFEDGYMYITFVVRKIVGATYKFSVDAEWLTMPHFRDTDTLGACAQVMTVEDGTRSGWYSYTETTVYNLDTTISEMTVTISNDDESDKSGFANDIEGNWYGSVAYFDLPNDYAPLVEPGFDVHIICSNFKAHFEYVGNLIYPAQPTNFNTTATYCHTRPILDFDLSIGIDLDGVSASIGIDSTVATDIRTASFDSSITYNP